MTPALSSFTCHHAGQRAPTLAAAAFLTLLALAPELAHATASTDKVTDAVTNITALLTAVGIGIVTIAVMMAGYKMAFQGARLVDVSNVLIGGTLAGGAAGLAAWIFA